MSIRRSIALWLAPELEVDYAKMQTLHTDNEDLGEAVWALRSQLSDAEDAVKRMKIARSPEGESQNIVKVRNEINDIFVRSFSSIEDRNRAIDSSLSGLYSLILTGSWR